MRNVPPPAGNAPRIGVGWDRHRLQAGRPCILGGVSIEGAPVGPVGHSDGDAVLHALSDALLGAAGLDDLGTLFPDHDERWRGASSATLLELTLERVASKQLRPVSADMVVVCDQPKIGPHRALLRARMAELLGLPDDRVNVKGKTTEGGRADFVEVTAVVLLESF